MTCVLAVVLRREALATVVLVRGDEELSRWPVPRTTCPDLAAVDVLARLALAARRLGCRIRLADADPDLLRLLELVGLAREVVGEPEDGEQLVPEEVVVADDAVT